MPSLRNKTLFITDAVLDRYLPECIELKASQNDIKPLLNQTIIGDSFEVLKKMPAESVDLIVTDPPYNLEKNFNARRFKKMDDASYIAWLEMWVKEAQRILKNTGSIYVCCDWKSSAAVYVVLKKYFFVQNRITWEREKGRSSAKNWKNNLEDIYFATKSKDFTFNLDKVMVKKNVLAPYKDEKGQAKDWFVENGQKYRLTAPSNVWTDITVPYWSMAENTEHPTQKPEKLIAKLILASSNEGDVVLDPFLGSGTTSVVAKKLNRKYIGIELDKGFAALAQKRLDTESKDIQGYNGKYFLAKGVKP
ncbi:MAG: site-specific DNA-methyltransferase [Alphaproteobacteria bacterium]|nr:site-specific DNA-methyltransferase [Alphaproteobacteria bacterium]